MSGGAGAGAGRRDGDLQEAVGINLIAEGAQPAVERQLDLIRMMRLQIANVEDARQGLQELRAMLRPDAMRRQNLRQRRVRRHLRRDRGQFAGQDDVVRANGAGLRRGLTAGRGAAGNRASQQRTRSGHGGWDFGFSSIVPGGTSTPATFRECNTGSLDGVRPLGLTIVPSACRSKHRQGRLRSAGCPSTQDPSTSPQGVTLYDVVSPLGRPDRALPPHRALDGPVRGRRADSAHCRTGARRQAASQPPAKTGRQPRPATGSRRSTAAPSSPRPTSPTSTRSIASRRRGCPTPR